MPSGRSMPVRMHRMFDGHDARWKKGKPLMKRFFDVPFNRAMSNAEYMECQAFVIGTMNGCDWPTDNFTDHISFKEMIEKSYVGTSELGLNMPWRVLKSKFDNDGLWPVFEERDGKCFVAFFQAGMRKTEWGEFTQDFVRQISQAL